MRAASATFYLLEWGALSAATVLLALHETPHPWLNGSLGCLGLCWGSRWLRTGKLTRTTPVDVPILLFVISASVALWVAPDRSAALVRFSLLLAAITFFYALVNSDLKSLLIFSSVFIVLTGLLGIFLVSQYDWTQIDARFQLTRQIGTWLNGVIPNLQLDLPYWNVPRNILGALLAISLLLALLGLLRGRSANFHSEPNTEKPHGRFSSIHPWVAGLSLPLILLGLILTESRTPWVVLGMILIGWAWWWLSGRMMSRLPIGRRSIFFTGLGVALLLVLLAVVRQPQLNSILARVPGPTDYLSRAEIYPQAWRLAQDTPFTGGGLAAFPGLYSTYIQGIPHNAFLNEDTGNNAYLNLLVEQGWLGLVSYLLILGIALITALRRLDQVDRKYQAFITAGALGIGFILVHGLMHATLVATRGIPFLLVPAGLALSGPDNPKVPSLDDAISANGSHQPKRTGYLVAGITLVAMLSAVIAIFRNTFLSAWYANLGAVHMAQVELADFPTGQWDDGSQVSALIPAQSLFQRSLTYHPEDRTAHHRLGLIAMLQRDFATAVNHLENAYRLDPTHRGIRKSLGYTYVWADQLESAYPLLVDIPEARDEMQVYEWWWGTQGRMDLAARAKQVALDL